MMGGVLSVLFFHGFTKKKKKVSASRSPLGPLLVSRHSLFEMRCVRTCGNDIHVCIIV